MAHQVIGIDVGSYAIKFVVIEAGFRRAHVSDSYEEPVGEGEGTLEERQTEAVRRGIERLKGESLFFSALPGDRTSVRTLELPFVDPRKVDQVVPYELEG